MSPKRVKKSKRVTVLVKKRGKSAIPKLIYANASPHSVGGVSMFAAGNRIAADTAANFASEEELIARAVNRLKDAGFQVLQVSPWTINIAGTKSAYEQAFGAELFAEERPVIKPGGVHDTGTFIDAVGAEIPGLIAPNGGGLADVIEGVAIEEPRYCMATSMFAPHKAYWHLDVPAGVSLGCNADKAHRAGITGKGIKVAMVDSGWFKHPFFVHRGYRVAPVALGPGAANPLADESGHGTGESANIFACAPDAELLPVKVNFVNSLGAFNLAVSLSPHIITCSWGSDTGSSATLSAANQALAVSISAAWAAGIVVIFSAGNGHVGFPGQHPDVISAGGVYMDKDESLRASNYSSGFNSIIYPGRRVPDLCGLVGMKPGANYIMLPLEPGDQIDVGKAGGVFPNGDETTANDGWAAFSGTSAAAPQLAGVAALLKQACGKLTPPQIRSILMSTARDVKTGNSNGTALTGAGGTVSVVGPDASTGNGLVDAHKAVLSAKVKCLSIKPPILPITGPIQPITGPIVPITGPIKPITGPIKPIVVLPIKPIKPIEPIVLPPPMEQSQAAAPAEGQAALSEEDAAELQDMISQSGFDPEE